MAGAEKNWHVDIRQLFLDPLKNPAYKAAFGTSRFENTRCHIRFDDKRTRVARLKQDKLAAFGFVWELLIENCTTPYNLGAYTTVDEQLVPFKGRSPSPQYMPSKPGKYGVKIFWLCDAFVPYAFNGTIYVGKQPGAATEKNLGQNFVLYLTAPIQNTGRNVTMDNYFTGIQLASMMLHRRLTIAGTVRKCKYLNA